MIGLAFLVIHIDMKDRALKGKSLNSKSYGKEAFINSAINTWSNIPKQLKYFLLWNLSTFQFKFFLKDHYLKKYYGYDIHVPCFRLICVFKVFASSKISCMCYLL